MGCLLPCPRAQDAVIAPWVQRKGLPTHMASISLHTSPRKTMDKTRGSMESAPLAVGDHVRFTYQGNEIRGVVIKRGRTSAHIRSEDQRAFRVPYHRLERLAQRVRPPLLSVSDQRRAAFHAGDRVQFPVRGATRQGVLVRVNPT